MVFCTFLCPAGIFWIDLIVESFGWYPDEWKLYNHQLNWIIVLIYPIKWTLSLKGISNSVIMKMYFTTLYTSFLSKSPLDSIRSFFLKKRLERLGVNLFYALDPHWISAAVYLSQNLLLFLKIPFLCEVYIFP